MPRVSMEKRSFDIPSRVGVSHSPGIGQSAQGRALNAPRALGRMDGAVSRQPFALALRAQFSASAGLPLSGFPRRRIRINVET